MRILWWLVILLPLGCGSDNNTSVPSSSDPTSFNGATAGDGPTFGGGSDGASGGSDGVFNGATDREDPGNGNPTEPGDKPKGEDGTVSQFDDPDTGCGYGTIYGIICSKKDQMYVNGADVWVEAEDCDGNLVKRQTVSDKDGFYTLNDVPNGLQTVHIQKAGWTKQYTVSVMANKLSDVTGVGHKECFQVVNCEDGVQSMPVESKIVTGLADIVMFIDTSGSMKQEASWVQQNVNAFAKYIGNQQIDYHVVLIAKGFNICVPPPLGGPNCSDGPNFRHIHEKIGSHDGLEKIISTYPQYQDFLRAAATTNFLAVTDDNSKKSASWFTQNANQQQNPGFSDPFVFHSIVAYGNIPFVGCLGGAFGGVEYLELTKKTGGAQFPVCETNWESIFGSMAESIVQTVQSVCAYVLPNPSKVAAADAFTLTYDTGANSSQINQVKDASGCGGGGGWYFDTPEAPEKIMLCSASCNALNNGFLSLDLQCL